MSPSQPALDLGTLIGARGPSVHWGRIGLLAVALLISGLVWILIQPLMIGRGVPTPAGWGIYVLGNVMLTASALVAYRWVGNDFAAAGVAALLHTLVMLPVSVWWTPYRDLPDFWHWVAVREVFRLTGDFLTFAGLAFAIMRVRPIWLAVGVGGLAGSLAYVILSPFVGLLVRAGVGSVRDQLDVMPFTIAEPLVFAWVFCGGLQLGWAALPELAAVPSAGALPAEPRRMPKELFVAVPATFFAIAFPLLILAALTGSGTTLPLLITLLVMAPGGVVMLALFYKMWAAIQDGHARATPGKALGLLFVPIFNIFWGFQVIPGFAKDYNSLLVRHGLNLPPLPVGLFTAYVVLSLTGVIPLVGLVLVGINYFVALVMIWKTCDAVNALPPQFPLRR